MASRSPDVLRFTSCMAPVADEFCRGLVRLLGTRLRIATELVEGLPWPERERLFDAGEIQVCWICGYPYVRKVDAGDGNLEILASPVARGARYGGAPVYYSDVVVRRDSPWTSLADLRGAVFAFNEPRSHSGAWVVRHALGVRGERSAFFGRLVESGAHETSLAMLESGDVDASAVDSTVLGLESRRRPGLRERLRVIESLGPSPIPPWVIRREVPVEARDAVRGTLLGLHEDAEGRALLAKADLERFVGRRDRDYDPIRVMARIGEQVPWI